MKKPEIRIQPKIKLAVISPEERQFILQEQNRKKKDKIFGELNSSTEQKSTLLSPIFTPNHKESAEDKPEHILVNLNILKAFEDVEAYNSSLYAD